MCTSIQNMPRDYQDQRLMNPLATAFSIQIIDCSPMIRTHFFPLLLIDRSTNQPNDINCSPYSHPHSRLWWLENDPFKTFFQTTCFDLNRWSVWLPKWYKEKTFKLCGKVEQQITARSFIQWLIRNWLSEIPIRNFTSSTEKHTKMGITSKFCCEKKAKLKRA